VTGPERKVKKQNKEVNEMANGVYRGDLFAADFLRFVLRQHGIGHVPVVKAIFAGNFAEAMPHLSKYARTNEGEYPDDPIAAEGYAAANAYNLIMTGHPEWKKREELLRMGFEEGHASMLAKLDAVIFLNLRKMLDLKTRLGQEEVDKLVTDVLAHECTHVVEDMLAKKIIVNFDYKHRFEHQAVERLLADFKSSVGEEEFARRYGKLI
jgi:hypothetical protein